MNKKGMTMVEIILVVALLGVLGVIISINAVAMLNKEKDKTNTEAKTRIEEACLTLCSLSTKKSTAAKSIQCENNTKFSLYALYAEGLITDEDYDSYKNTEQELKITIENSELKCKFE